MLFDIFQLTIDWVRTSHRVLSAEPALPEWVYSLWFSGIFIFGIVLILLLSAYGVHLYMQSRNRKKYEVQEKVLDTRMAHVKETAEIVKEANEELSWTNDALQDFNDTLHQENETLTWSNNLLTDANLALERRTAELRRALENNKEILGITAHDLKNPLGGIIGLTGMLIEDISTVKDRGLREESLQNLGMLKETAEGMLNTVKELLDRHRDGLPAKLNFEEVDLNLVARIVTNWNRQQANKKAIQLNFRQARDSVRVAIDVSAMQRVIDNLISNAIKYSPVGKRVWVEIVPMELTVVLNVRDEGPGLTEEDKTRVFGKLNRLSAKPTGGEHSSGLGLYIVKKLVGEHNGSVGVDSEHGKGATFWIKLPLVQDRIEI